MFRSCTSAPPESVPSNTETPGAKLAKKGPKRCTGHATRTPGKASHSTRGKKVYANGYSMANGRRLRWCCAPEFSDARQSHFDVARRRSSVPVGAPGSIAACRAVDAGWCLLLPEVSFPAALAAICLETHALLFRWGTDTAVLRVHGVAVVLWLLGNSTWMVFELLFSPSTGQGRHFPWYSGPMVTESESLYNIGCIWSSVLFGGALALLLGFYAQAAMELRRSSQAVQMDNPQDAVEFDSDEQEELVFGLLTPEAAGIQEPRSVGAKPSEMME
ncbi:unnamed protein product [Prorocentrum cordatum]|uniref:Uncharacterized protein n=1 Tax=Prorocentrum cordatum TaxID=2364126 RepID=A0ABN9TAM7_9DINO|nr:unnamed protein product [Polarella glacialis]